MHLVNPKKIVTVVIGTRPGIVKMAPVYHAVADNPHLDARLIYTGQHYSITLKDAVWRAFNLPEPDHVIEDIQSTTSHATQLAKMMIGCEEAFRATKTDVVLVCGDANTNLSAGIVARKMDLELGHVESGLRSYDWSMPEEHNRIILDRISDYLFAPTEQSSEILRSEQVQGKIYTTGNTVVDSLYFALENDKLNEPDIGNLDDRFSLLTTHRQENVDNPERLAALVQSIQRLSDRVQILFPLHPRTQKMLSQFGMMERLMTIENVVVTEALSYPETLWAIRHAQVVLTDSGGLQEECCIMKTPCVTLRDNTERPETLAVGANIIAGVSPDGVIAAFEKQIVLKGTNGNKWDNPFGDGKAAIRVANAVL